jgi:aryl-alcohol dehydrogenase-like predicted oxidoreductase
MVVAMAIEQHFLGRTGTNVTILGYGAMELCGDSRGPVIDDEEAGRLLNAVLDGGVNLIDTSIDYGRSEELIGRYLKGRRDEYFLATKCGCPLVEQPDDAGSTPHDFRSVNIRAGLEQSLRRLQTDRVDLLQIHMTPSRDQLEQDNTVGTLNELRAEGKVRFIGISGTVPNLGDQIEMGVFDVFQIPYSALQREHEVLITKAADTGAGILIRGGAARGTATDEKEWSQRPIGLAEGAAQRRWESSGVQDLLGGMSRHEFVLRFTLSLPELSSTIVGTSKVSHLQSNLAIAALGPLPLDIYEEAKRRLGPPDPDGTGYVRGGPTRTAR